MTVFFQASMSESDNSLIANPDNIPLKSFPQDEPKNISHFDHSKHFDNQQKKLEQERSFLSDKLWNSEEKVRVMKATRTRNVIRARIVGKQKMNVSPPPPIFSQS
jgi:hypothetical protein